MCIYEDNAENYALALCIMHNAHYAFMKHKNGHCMQQMRFVTILNIQFSIFSLKGDTKTESSFIFISREHSFHQICFTQSLFSSLVKQLALFKNFWY